MTKSNNKMEQLELCRTCQNKSFNSQVGIICGLTNAKPTFSDTCPDYLRNEKAYERRQKDIKRYEYAELKEATGGLNVIGIKSSIVAGAIFIAVSLIGSFFLLTQAGRISLWLFALFIFGFVLIVRGLSKKK